MSPDAPLVGLVGCGGWGKNILRDLRVLGASVEVVARSPETRARADEGGAARIVGKVDDLGPVDGIVVATPAGTHYDVLLDVLERRAPVYVEKPMVVDAAQADALATAASDRLFVMHKWRYHPGIQALASLAQSGRLGDVTQVQTRRLGWGNHHPDVDMFWTLAPHDLSIVLEILGTIPPPSAAVGEMAPGGLVDLTAFLGDDHPVAVVNVSARHPVRDRTIRVHGTEAVAVLPDPYASTLTVVYGHDQDEPRIEHIEISTEWPLLRELRAFIGHLGGGPPPKSTAAEGALTVRRLTEMRELAGFDS